METEQAVKLAATYINGQLLSIGNDYADVEEFLRDEGLPPGGLDQVSHQIQVLAARVRESINLGGKNG